MIILRNNREIFLSSYKEKKIWSWKWKKMPKKYGRFGKKSFFAIFWKLRSFLKNISLLLRRTYNFLQNKVLHTWLCHVVTKFHSNPFPLFSPILAAILFFKMATMARKNKILIFFNSVFYYLYYGTKLVWLSPFLKKKPFDTLVSP